VRVRVSWLQPVVWVWLWHVFDDLAMGSTVFFALFASVLLHEIGHVVAARRSGGTADDIVLWPLGGLAGVSYGPSPMSRFFTAAAGPLVNLMLLLACLPYTLVWAARPETPSANVSTSVTSTVAANSAVSGKNSVVDSAAVPVRRPSPWNPLVLPISKLGEDWAGELQVIVFSLNWMLLLLNLLPISPLDGFNMTRGVMETTSGKMHAAELMPKVGLIGAVAMVVLTSLFLKNTTLTGLFAFLGMMSAIEYGRPRWGEADEEGFLGYDFSEGYTSLERSSEDDDDGPVAGATQVRAAEKSPGMWQKWKENRDAERERREREEFELEQLKLDDLLAKVHERGMNGLSDGEKRELKQLSERLRSRGKANS
jgi:Zn-dependent protease